MGSVNSPFQDSTITDPNDIFEHYLCLKEADCIRIDTELFDKKVDIEYTHIIDVAVCCNVSKGDPNDARLTLKSLAISLDCLTCKRVRRTVSFQEDGSSACTGSTGHEDPGYPGQIIAKYDYIIKKGSKKLLLSMYRLGIKWEPFTSSKYERVRNERI